MVGCSKRLSDKVKKRAGIRFIKSSLIIAGFHLIGPWFWVILISHCGNRQIFFRQQITFCINLKFVCREHCKLCRREVTLFRRQFTLCRKGITLCRNGITYCGKELTLYIKGIRLYIKGIRLCRKGITRWNLAPSGGLGDSINLHLFYKNGWKTEHR